MVNTNDAPGGNPWLSIPASDYEAHMDSPAVGQLAALNRLFRDVYREQLPARLAVLGCTTGNGFVHIDPAATARVVGVDINPDYIEIARRRYAAVLPGLELYCADLAECDFPAAAFDMVYAALVFEYVDVSALLKKTSGWLGRGGLLAAVLQLEHDAKAPVTATEYASLRLLEPLMRLVPPVEFLAAATQAGLSLVREWEVPLASGKRFWAGILAKSPA